MLLDMELVHIVGIGGIGMSALAKFMKHNKIVVQGSDSEDGYMIQSLTDLGIPITIGHAKENIGTATTIVRSTAIKDDHIEIIEARKRGLKILHRSEALAILLVGFKTIAVTGTHGKSTTTSMIGELCIAAGLDPTIINGAIIEQLNDNVRLGKSQLAVIESDESDESFLVLPADIGCVTNMNPDHLDHYKNVEAMYSSYDKFINKIPQNSFCLLCADHPKIKSILADSQKESWISYGIESNADIKAFNIKFQNDGMSFDIELSDKIQSLTALQSKYINNFKLHLYGQHNVQNVTAAIAIALLLGVDCDQVINAVATIRGARRRFTHVGTKQDIMIIDDYAHHPVEINATLSIAKNLAKIRGGRVIAVMQPHRYSRFMNMLDDFSECFSDADLLILTPIYAAGEKPVAGVSVKNLFDKIIKAEHTSTSICENQTELVHMIKINAQAQDLVVFLGAGDITNWAKKLYNDIDS